MCKKLRLALGLSVLLLLLPWAATAQAAKARAGEWLGPDPYRNFLGVWQGTDTRYPGNVQTPVRLTITEDKTTASMLWRYAYGTPGTRSYEESEKRVVLAPSLNKMVIHWAGEPGAVYDVVDLEKFQKAGIGSLVAVIHFDKRNYWHVKHAVESKMTLELSEDRLAYRWDTQEHGKTEPYSRFEFMRQVATAP